MKRFLSYLCCLALLLGMLVSPVCAEDVIETGRLGDNITYTFYRTQGRLQIEGYGPMWDFVPGDFSSIVNPHELNDYQKLFEWDEMGEISPLRGDTDIRHIEISDGITRIGSCVFFLCSGLKDVTFGKDVSEIGKLAFAGDKFLKKVEFPKSVRLLEERCFAACEQLGTLFFFGDAPELRWGTWKISQEYSVDISPFHYIEDSATPVLFYTQEASGWPIPEHNFQEYGQLLIPFTDLPLDDRWLLLSVGSGTGEDGYLQGVGNQMFAPARIATRAEFLTAVYRKKGSVPSNKQVRFPDVAKGTWYFDALCWAVNEGIVFGYPDGTFRPNQPITRQEAAVILYRCRTEQGEVNVERIKGEVLDFDQVSSFAGEAMCWARAKFLIWGMNNEYALRFAPDDTMTRGEMAFILSHSF